MFSPQQEIWDYLRHCVNKYGSARTSATAPRHRRGVRRGDRHLEVRVNDNECSLALAGHRRCRRTAPAEATPDLPGLDTFEGTTFHSAHWNHEHDLRGRGSRSSAPAPARSSSCRRSPRPSPTSTSTSAPHRGSRRSPTARSAYANATCTRKLPAGQRFIRNLLYWALELRGIGFAISPKLMKGSGAAGAATTCRSRCTTPRYAAAHARLRRSAASACCCQQRLLPHASARRRRPRHRRHQGGDGRTASSPADGTEREADTIVFGTGFEVSGNLTRMKIVGRDGVELNDRWERDGMGAHLGITIAGFPNLFLLVGPNTGLGHNSMIFMIEQQVAYVIQALGRDGSPRRRLGRGRRTATATVRRPGPDPAVRQRVERLQELVPRRRTAATSRSGRTSPGSTGRRPGGCATRSSRSAARPQLTPPPIFRRTRSPDDRVAGRSRERAGFRSYARPGRPRAGRSGQRVAAARGRAGRVGSARRPGGRPPAPAGRRPSAARQRPRRPDRPARWSAAAGPCAARPGRPDCAVPAEQRLQQRALADRTDHLGRHHRRLGPHHRHLRDAVLAQDLHRLGDRLARVRVHELGQPADPPSPLARSTSPTVCSSCCGTKP